MQFYAKYSRYVAQDNCHKIGQCPFYKRHFRELRFKIQNRETYKWKMKRKKREENQQNHGRRMLTRRCHYGLDGEEGTTGKEGMQFLGTILREGGLRLDSTLLEQQRCLIFGSGSVNAVRQMQAGRTVANSFS